MSITSAIINPITCIHLDDNEPSIWNTSHSELKDGSWTILDYCQPFKKDMTVYQQFVSPDSDVVPTLIFYFTDGITKEITGSLDRTISGDQTRYFFNFEITLDSDFYDKESYFIVNQGTDYWQSEPIYVYDVAEDIANGVLRKIVYSNYDRILADLNGYYIDFSTIDNTDHEMCFYVNASMRELAPESETDILQQTESDIVISSSSKSGSSFKTGIIPPKIHYKLQTVCGLDYFEVNGREYIVTGVEQETTGGSTSVETTITMTDKLILGFNTDDTGYETTTTSDIMNLEYLSKSADFDFERPEGYMLHQIIAKHSGASNTASVICGNSLSSQEYINTINGSVPYSTNLKTLTIPHHTPSTEAGRIYIGLSGTGVILDFYIQLIKITAE